MKTRKQCFPVDNTRMIQHERANVKYECANADLFLRTMSAMKLTFSRGRTFGRFHILLSMRE